MSVDARSLHEDVCRVLRDVVPSTADGDIALAALWIVQAELLGLPEFGLRMLARELDLPGDGIHRDAPAAPTSPIGSIDASGLPGVVALAAAVRGAQSLVRQHGLAIIGIRGAGALGVLGTAALAIALDGAVALIAAHSGPFVAPWGATAAAIGTNPLAVAAPRHGLPPLVIDYATSPLTLAAVRELGARGEHLPTGTAVDVDGLPTTAPSDVAALLPSDLTGSLTGLMVEVIAGVATGGRTDAGDRTRGAVVIAFDPARTGGHDAAGAAVRLSDDWIRAGGHLPGRFDGLPSTRQSLPSSFDPDPAGLAWLRDRLGSLGS